MTRFRALAVVPVALLLTLLWSIARPPLFGPEESDRLAQAVSSSAGSPLGTVSPPGRAMTVTAGHAELIEASRICFRRDDPEQGGCLVPVPHDRTPTSSSVSTVETPTMAVLTGRLTRLGSPASGLQLVRTFNAIVTAGFVSAAFLVLRRRVSSRAAAIALLAAATPATLAASGEIGLIGPGTGAAMLAAAVVITLRTPTGEARSGSDGRTPPIRPMAQVASALAAVLLCPRPTWLLAPIAVVALWPPARPTTPPAGPEPRVPSSRPLGITLILGIVTVPLAAALTGLPLAQPGAHGSLQTLLDGLGGTGASTGATVLPLVLWIAGAGLAVAAPRMVGATGPVLGALGPTTAIAGTAAILTAATHTGGRGLGLVFIAPVMVGVAAATAARAPDAPLPRPVRWVGALAILTCLSTFVIALADASDSPATRPLFALHGPLWTTPVGNLLPVTIIGGGAAALWWWYTDQPITSRHLLGVTLSGALAVVAVQFATNAVISVGEAPAFENLYSTRLDVIGCLYQRTDEVLADAIATIPEDVRPDRPTVGVSVLTLPVDEVLANHMVFPRGRLVRNPAEGLIVIEYQQSATGACGGFEPKLVAVRR